jgi:hypothetical protein
MKNERTFFDRWSAIYLNEKEMAQPVPERMGRAMKRMFRAATHRDVEVGPAWHLTELIKEDPTRPLWATCGSACRLYTDAIAPYGYTTELVSLWFASKPNKHFGHVAVRFAGPGYSDFAFYDPLYGATLVHKDKKWAGLRDILLNLDTGTPELDILELEPYAPSPSKYENTNRHDYSAIFPRYFNAVITRDHDKKMVVQIRDTQRCNPLAVLEHFRAEDREITVYVKYA